VDVIVPQTLSHNALGRQARAPSSLSRGSDFRYLAEVVRSVLRFDAVLSFAVTISGCVLGVKSPPTHEQSKSGPPANRSEPTAATLVSKGSVPDKPVVEPVGPPPVAGAVWVPGYWHWSGVRYEWIVGHWTANPGGWVDAQRDPKGRVLR
jgi:hypothetical protein